MFLFRRKKDRLDYAAKEREIQAIHKETLKTIDEAKESAVKLNKLLEKNGGITELIFYATGGDRRGIKK